MGGWVINIKIGGGGFEKKKNWNYSSAEFEDSLYEDVQGPDEGDGTGDGRRKETTEEHDDQRGHDINGVLVGGDRLNHADHGKREDGGGEVRKTNVKAGIEKSTYRYENVIELPIVPMPLGRLNKEGQDRYRFKEMRKNGINDDASSELQKRFVEGVEEAIANVDAAYGDGEERLVQALEDLEGKVLAEKVEEEELMLRVHQFYDATPRRSARLAKKRLEPKE